MAAPQLTWTNIVITVAAIATISSLGASVIQYQLSGLDQKITKVDHDAVERDKEAKHDREIKDFAIEKKFDTLNEELLRRAELFLTTKEFAEFKARIIDRTAVSESRLNVIEQTRPTAETLKAISNNAETRLDRLEERVRALENAPRAPALVPGK